MQNKRERDRGVGWGDGGGGSEAKSPRTFLPSFLKYCKDITNLLFLILLACLAMISKNDTNSL